MIDELIQATAARLGALWPGSEVYAAAIAQNAPGAWHVGVRQAERTAGIGRRQRQRVQIEVRYYLPPEGCGSFGEWAQVMLDGFGMLEGERGTRMRLKNCAAIPDTGGGYYAFCFLADLSYVEQEEEEQTMENLEYRQLAGMREPRP